MQPIFDNLLKLQALDLNCFKLLSQTQSIPIQIQNIQAQINSIQSQQLSLKSQLHQAEKDAHNLNLEIQSLEEKIRKLKHHLLNVKKNDEFQLVSHDIHLSSQKISHLEDLHIQALYAIDSLKEKNSQEITHLSKDILSYQNDIQALQDSLPPLQTQLQAAISEKDSFQNSIDPQSLRKYQQVANQLKKPPFIVSLDNGRCLGCHLKVSSDVLSKVRSQDGIHQCDNCHRILVWPS